MTLLPLFSLICTTVDLNITIMYFVNCEMFLKMLTTITSFRIKLFLSSQVLEEIIRDYDVI